MGNRTFMAVGRPNGIQHIDWQDDGTAKVFCKSMKSGNINDFTVTSSQGDRIEEYVRDGHTFIQEALSDLSDEYREMIMTGLTDDEWNEMWGDEEEEEWPDREEAAF